MTEKRTIKEVYVPGASKSEKHPQVYIPTPPRKPSNPRPPQGGGIPPAGKPNTPVPSKSAEDAVEK